MAAANMHSRNFKLTYFAVRGLGEPIRWIFHYHKIPFEETRVEWNYPKWIEQDKRKYKSTGYQLPALEFDNGKVLGHSQVISRYLANELSFGGDTNLEKAHVDEVINSVFDLFNQWRSRLFVINKEERAFMQTLLDMQFPVYYRKFNRLLEGSGGDYVMGTKLTHADFWLANIIDILDGPITDDMPRPVMPFDLPPPQASDFKEDFSLNYPKLRAHKELVMNIPQIKAWIQKRPRALT